MLDLVKASSLGAGLLVLSISLFSGCGDDGGVADGGALDSGEPADGGPGDSAVTDTGARDGAVDGGGDAGREDAGSGDAATDGGPDASTDAGTDAAADAAADGGADSGAGTDAGTDAGPGGCTASSDCARTEYCKTVDGMCGGTGSCDPIGSGICPAVYDPVCGCDGTTYGNRCSAAGAGMSVDAPGECASTTMCRFRPRSGCCFEDSQCSGSAGRTSRCIGAVCSVRSEGVCKDTPAPGRCWDDAHCGATERCVGASICPCGVLCFAPDTLGTCSARVTP